MIESPDKLSRFRNRAISLIAAIARHEDVLSKLLALVLTPVLVAIVFLKFAADVAAAALLNQGPAMLSSYTSYWSSLQGVMRPRFGGNYCVYWLAKGIEHFIHIPADPRLHPLRIAAVIVSTISIWIGAAPLLLDKTGRWNWRIFYAAFLLMSLIGFYCYMPYDMPSIALISVGLWWLLHRRPGVALVAMLICGLFRESSLHLVWFSISLLFVPPLSPGLKWATVFLAAFFIEWAAIRHFLPTENRIHFTHLFDDITSLTLWASVAMVFGFGAQATIHLSSCAQRADASPATTSEFAAYVRFFAIQIAMILPWLAFYKLNTGNLAEFRMLMPVVLPLAYAMALR